MKIVQSQRLQDLPPYIFSEINRLKAEALKRGTSLLSLAIGDPDRPTPPAIVDAIVEASRKPQNHAYSPYEGTLEFRRAVANWFEGRFGVALEAESEVMALIGSKEGIAHFPMAFCNPGDVCLYPSPGYPVFQASIQLGGGKPVALSLTADSGFQPDPNRIEELFREHRPRYCILNFPSNPTSAVISRSLLEAIVGLARQYQVFLLYDNAYSEIYFDPAHKPLSILEIPGAKEIAIELHSFSKTYNMTGWRIGFAVGNRDLVAGLLRAKTNIDSGPLLAVQDACTRILPISESFSSPIRDLYRQRRQVVLEGLQSLGIEFFRPEATFFVWARVPQGGSSMDFTKKLIEKSGLVVTPGIGFGEEGEGFFRLALTIETDRIAEALNRLEAVL